MRAALKGAGDADPTRRKTIDRLVQRLTEIDDVPELLFITNGELDRFYFKRYLRDKYEQMSDDELRAEDEHLRRLSEINK